MARITKEQRAQNLEHFDNTILEIFKESGWRSVTYESLSIKTGIRASTLQRYYPTAKHFFQPLKGKIIPFLIDALDFSNESAFLSSWSSALEDNNAFKWSVNLLLTTAIDGDANNSAKQPVEVLIRIIDEKTNNKGRALIERAIGLSTLKFLDM